MNKKIDWDEIHDNIDPNVIDEIRAIGNSCGVISCYVLSLIYKFPFSPKEFMWTNGEGMREYQLHDYIESKGIKVLSKEKAGGKPQLTFLDLDVLHENGIVMSIAGKNTNNGSPHTSLICEYNKGIFRQVFCNKNDCIENVKDVDGLYISFFYAPGTQIEKFAWFKDEPENLLDRFKEVFNF